MSLVKTCGSITLSEIKDGIDVIGIIEQYYKSSSATELIGGSWTNTYPGWESDKYIWTKTITTYSDGKSTETTPICATGDKGANGRGISSVDVYFYQSSSATELKDGSWSTTAPVWANGKYVWSKTITTYDDGNTDETTPVCITGSKGETGEGALTVVIGNESQNIPCTETGIASSAFLINIPFAGYKGTNRVTCTVSVGTLPSGATLKTNTASTTSADGSIVLSVANGATFGGSSVLTGEITLTFTLENKSIIKKFTWAKTKDGAASIDYILEPSSLVIKKGYDNTLSPSAITFSAYSRTGNVTTRTVYAGRFIISESTNGTTFTNKYSSASNESSKTYTPSSTNVKAIRCILYASGGTTTQLDMQTVVILTDVDNIDGELDTIRTSISGVESKVDAVEKSITDKVWQDDITNSINNYDNITTESIRSRVSQVEQDVNGIKSTVSDVQTTLTEKADGSTVTELSEKVSTLEQDANGFKQTVSNTYATKDSLNNYSTTEQVQSIVEQKADSILGKVTDSEGNETTYQGTLAGLASQVKDAEGNITKITQTAKNITQEISDAKGSSTTLQARLEGIDSSVVDAETNAKSFATQEAERIQSTVTQEYKGYVDGIKYGVRNLLRDTANLTKWKAETGIIVSEEDGWFKITDSSHTSSYYGIYTQVSDYEQNTDYTVSVDVKYGNCKASLYIGYESFGSLKRSISEEGSQRFEYTFNTGNNTKAIRVYLAIHPTTANCYGYFKLPKLEKGNRATDWTPAPEDIESTVSTVESNISQRADSIELNVSKKKDSSLTAIRYIRDWLKGSSVSSNNHWVECKVMSNNLNIVDGLTATLINADCTTASSQPTSIDKYTDSNTNIYDTDGNVDTNTYVVVDISDWSALELDLGEVHKDIDYIQIWHYYDDNRVYNHKLEVSSDRSKWYTLYDSDIQGGYTESDIGKVHDISNNVINEQLTSFAVRLGEIESNISDGFGNVNESISTVEGNMRKIVSDSIDEAKKEINGSISELPTTDKVSALIEERADKITTEMMRVTDDLTTRVSKVEQDSDKWSVKFAELGMGEADGIETIIKLSSEGIRVSQSDGSEVLIDTNGLQGLYNNLPIFQLKKDLTITERVEIANGADFTSLKYINREYQTSNGTVKCLVHVVSGGSS